MSKRKEATIKIGQVYTSWSCGDFIVTNYHNYRNVNITFLDTGYECKTRGDCVVDGRVKDLLSKSVYGVGFIGDGPHRPTMKGEKNPAYTHWHAMMTRCYGVSSSNYDDCLVEIMWHNFQNFADWYDIYPFRKDGFHLDKDLKIKGNRVYSEDACSFVPRQINNLFGVVDKENKFTGTSFRKNMNKWTAQIYIDGAIKFLGYFTERQNALIAYQKEKNKALKYWANYHKDDLDPRVYSSLINWDFSFENNH